MLFRRSTRHRFVLLVLAFLFIIGFNCSSYLKKYHDTGIQTKEILDETAFKVFFLRFKTQKDLLSFFHENIKNLENYGSFIVNNTFIYQNNLYIPFSSIESGDYENKYPDSDFTPIFYNLFDINEIVKTYLLKGSTGGNQEEIRNIYIDYNGDRLNENSLIERHKNIQRDLFDIAFMIRDDATGKRIDIYNSIADLLIRSIERVPAKKGHRSNPFLSRVECIVPVNLINILANIRRDNATDFMELSQSVKKEGGIIMTSEMFLKIPDEYSAGPIYKEINVYPRYLPFFNPDILTTKWRWLLYKDIHLEKELMDYFDQLHFRGHYMYSYEKQHIIRDKVEKINRDIRSNHMQFYLTDLSMGIAFPFIISLFAFIHLKREISFLLMFKNRIREILAIFWLIPVALMILIKLGILAGYLIYYGSSFIYLSSFVIVPLIITVVIASILFIPVNRYCFSPFTGNMLNLYWLHRG